MHSEKARKETSKEAPKKPPIDATSKGNVPLKTTTVTVAKKTTTTTTVTTKQTTAGAKAPALGRPAVKHFSPKPLGIRKRSEEIAIEDYKTQIDHEQVVIEDKPHSESENRQTPPITAMPPQASLPKPVAVPTPPRLIAESPASDHSKKTADRSMQRDHLDKKRPATDLRSQKQPQSVTPPPNKQQPQMANKTPRTSIPNARRPTKPSLSPKPPAKHSPNLKPPSSPTTKKSPGRIQVDFGTPDSNPLKMPSLEKASSEIFDETADGIDEKVKTLTAFMRERKEDPAPASSLHSQVKVDLFQSMINSNQSKPSASQDKLQQSTMMNDSKNAKQLKTVAEKLATNLNLFIPNLHKSSMGLDNLEFKPLQAPGPQDPPGKPSAFLSVFNDPAQVFESFLKLGVEAAQAPMVSTVCALEIKTKADPETNVRRLLNTDQAFDQKEPERGWVNWGSKSFTPKEAANNPQKPTLSTFIGKSETFEATRRRLEQAGQVFEDESFPPNMSTLRGFGSDESWE